MSRPKRSGNKPLNAVRLSDDSIRLPDGTVAKLTERPNIVVAGATVIPCEIYETEDGHRTVLPRLEEMRDATFADRVIDKANKDGAQAIVVWRYPREDHETAMGLCEVDAADYDEYLARINPLIAQAERSGIKVLVCQATPKRVCDWLLECHLENTQQNRLSAYTALFIEQEEAKAAKETE